MSQYTGAAPDTIRAPDWRDQGTCRDQDPELFFASDATKAGQADTEHAKAICRACPVLATCREWALTTRQKFGVWGGLGEKERRNILRQRTRGTRGGRRTTTKAAA